MSILSRYLIASLVAAYLVAAVTIGGLLWLLQMLDILEQGLSSTGDIFLAAFTAASKLPEGLIDLLPVITVLATAAAMSTLQARNELTVMRVSGMSIIRLTGVALVPGIAVSVLALAALQWVTPQLQHGQERVMGASLGESGLWHPWHGLWVRSDNEFLNVQNLRPGRIPAGIDIYQMDDDGRLIRQIRSSQALARSDGSWVLEDVRIRNFNMPDDAYFQELDHLVWQSFLSGSQLELLLSPPANLALSDLWLYVTGLKQRQQDVAEFEMVFWRRLALPLTCLTMVLAAMATAAVPLKSRAVSVRLVSALVLGLGFQMLTELATYLGLVMKWPVVPVALVPPILLALFAGWLLARAR